MLIALQGAAERLTCNPTTMPSSRASASALRSSPLAALLLMSALIGSVQRRLAVSTAAFLHDQEAMVNGSQHYIIVPR